MQIHRITSNNKTCFGQIVHIKQVVLDGKALSLTENYASAKPILSKLIKILNCDIDSQNKFVLRQIFSSVVSDYIPGQSKVERVKTFILTGKEAEKINNPATPILFKKTLHQRKQLVIRALDGKNPGTYNIDSIYWEDAEPPSKWAAFLKKWIKP